MRVAEVAGMEGVGRGVMALLRLWKCVEKSRDDIQAMPIDSTGAGLYCPRQHVTQIANTVLTLFMRPDPSQRDGAGPRCIPARGRARFRVLRVARIQVMQMEWWKFKPGGGVCLYAGYF
jgi:hypothetical protein